MGEGSSPPPAISTSVGDTVRLLGIEAGRAKIVSETRSFMEDNTPNLRHLFLYADEMTRTDVRWVIDFLEAENLRYATDTNSPEGWTVERHLRHWRRVLASIDAFEGVAA